MSTTEERVTVEFIIESKNRAVFERELKVWSDHEQSSVVGYRADDQVERRAALRLFVDQMEHKLRKNEHKSNWRDKPIEALFKLLLLEVEEFKVAHEFFSVAEARPELVDVANFALICWDRLGQLEQERNAKEQKLRASTTPMDPSGDGSFRGPDGAA